MITIAFVEREQEYHRFTCKVLQADHIISYDTSILSKVAVLRQILKTDVKLAFVGLRVIDLHVIRTLTPFAKEIIVLQHAVNENQTSFTARFLFANFSKIAAWTSFLFILKCLVVWGRKTKKTSHSTITVFHFTDYYKRRFEQVGSAATFYKCSWPNPFTYGCIEQMPMNSRQCEAFYVDEPLEKTLGWSIKRQRDALSTFISQHNIDSLEVRLHPRSNPEKFLHLPGVSVVNDIPNAIDNLLGYKSNLLFGDFNTQNFYRLNSSNATFELELFTPRNGDYVSEVKSLLNEIRTLQ